jgi:RNA polymerase sigma-70 factor (ECF subfamily)
MSVLNKESRMPAALQLQPSTKLSDAELSRRIAAGDTKAFAQLMRQYNRKLFRTARAILRDDAEAEDALQEAYLRAYRSMSSFRDEAKLSTWLVRIVANEALARRRKQVRRAQILPLRGGGTEEHEAEAESSMPHQDGPEGLAQRSQIRRLLEARIDALPDAFRAVFVLRALEELTVEETAAALGIPEATVRTRFFRARSQLREALSLEIDLALDDAFAFAGERCDRIVARVMARLAGGEGDPR